MNDETQPQNRKVSPPGLAVSAKELAEYIHGTLEPDRASHIAKLADSTPELKGRIDLQRALAGLPSPPRESMPPWVRPLSLLFRHGFKAANLLAALMVICVVVSIWFSYQNQVNTLRSEVRKLDTLLAEVRGNEPVKLLDPKAFRPSGFNRIETELDIDPSRVKEVRVRWGGEATGVYTTIYPTGAEPTARGVRTRIQSQSSPFDLGGGGDVVTATLQIVPHPGVAEGFPQLFKQGVMTLRREFLVTQAGLVADPDPTTHEGARLDVPARIHLQGQGRQHELNGVAFRDGWLVVLVRPVGKDLPWWIQDEGKHRRVVAGQPFSVTCHFGVEEPEQEFEIKTVVVPSLDRSPFKGKQQVRIIDSVDRNGQYIPVSRVNRVTVIRPVK